MTFQNSSCAGQNPAGATLCLEKPQLRLPLWNEPRVAVEDTPVAVEIFVLIDGLEFMLRNGNEVAVRIGFEYLGGVVLGTMLAFG